MSEKPRCPGPIFEGDQGIEFCETCGGCVCCNETVDHTVTDRLCVINDDGRCVLKIHSERDCVK